MVPSRAFSPLKVTVAHRLDWLCQAWEAKAKTSWIQEFMAKPEKGQWSQGYSVKLIPNKQTKGRTVLLQSCYWKLRLLYPHTNTCPPQVLSESNSEMLTRPASLHSSSRDVLGHQCSLQRHPTTGWTDADGMTLSKQVIRSVALASTAELSLGWHPRHCRFR